MTFRGNIHMAFASLAAAKWRSFLTMLGVIIGVMSVVIIVSLGQGIKQQLSDENKSQGNNLLTIRGGRIVSRDNHGHITRVNVLNAFVGANLNDDDVKTIQRVSHLDIVSPFALITGLPKTSDNQTDDTITVVATNDKGAVALNQKILYGGFFGAGDSQNAVAVIGQQAAEQLFKENVPIGKSFQFRGQQFVVQGVFQQFKTNPLNPGIDYNNTIFIPYDYAKQIASAVPQPYQILVRPDGTTSPDTASANITSALKKAHGGQLDFTVLEGRDNLVVASSLINILTRFIAAVAAISLIVGGIGIMNIMLVAVSERTAEVGIRKSVGGTNRQILAQFMTEAIMLSAIGGVLGIIASLFANYFIRLFTDLQPAITFPIMGFALFLAVVVGTVFGITPALKAARKDPIDALRRT